MPDRLHIPGKPPRALRWTDQHPQSSYGSGVLIYRHGGTILDGAGFRLLRDGCGAWLETNKPERARKAMRLMQDESLGTPPQAS